MEDILTNPAIRSEESVVAMERMYIGGFVEDRLSARDIVNRLQTNPPDGIRFVSFDVFPTFVFATLCHTTPTCTPPPATTTAVQVVAAQYNNVRWKGCKLKVEPAKPHILQVFALERQQQQQQQVLQPQTVLTPSILPRHLRIRRRRGEEITKVDTKPKTIQIPITSTAFAKLGRNTLSSSLKNRALHIRFLQDVEEEFSSFNTNNHNHNNNNNVSEEDSSSSCSTDNTSTTSSSNESSDTLPFTNLNTSSKSKYQWSDEEDEDEDEDNASCLNTDHQGIELDADLSRDVSNNMNILSQLFPDLQHNTNPVIENSTNAQQQHQQQQQQHQRYDPTSASAKQFEIITPSKDTTNTLEQENLQVLLQKNSEIPQTTNNNFITNETNTTIYQEKKLETIFQCSTLKTKQKLNDTLIVKSGFGFEFPLEEDTKEEVDDCTNDILPSTATNTIVQVEVEEDTNRTSTTTANDSKKRRLGFVFPQQLLDQWEEEFFAMDTTMTEDEWEERRKTLTLDWKRKYKLVQTQEQKRTKKRMSK